MADETYRRDDELEDDGIQHGIDDNPSGDAEKGAVLGGLGGAATGAAAGAMAGPMGALAGAAIGGVAGAVASGLAVGAVDRIDNDNTLTGIGDGSTSDVEDKFDNDDRVTGTSYDTGTTAGIADDVNTHVPSGDVVGYPGASGAYGTTSPSGDVPVSVDDDPAYRRVAQDASAGAYDASRDNYDASIDNDVPGIQTGGRNADGSVDTRGIMEKTADAVTGDKVDDKTGKPI